MHFYFSVNIDVNSAKRLQKILKILPFYILIPFFLEKFFKFSKIFLKFPKKFKKRENKTGMSGRSSLLLSDVFAVFQL